MIQADKRLINVAKKSLLLTVLLVSWNKIVALRCSIVVPETYFLSRLTFKCEREGDSRNGL